MQAGGIAIYTEQLHGRCYFSAFSELQRISDNIVQHLPQPYRISSQRLRHRRADLAGELDSFPGRMESKALHDVIQQLADAEPDLFQIETACFNFRKIEDVVDDGEQGTRGGAHNTQVF